MHERYSIEVNDGFVEIYGDLTIEETFDFLSFYERKGYKSVVIGSENSTLRMMKKDREEEIHDQFVMDLKQEIVHYKNSFHSECEGHKVTQQKLKDIEVLMKQLMSEEYAKYKALYEENQKIIRSNMIMQLKDNPEVKEIIENKFEEIPQEKSRSLADFIDNHPQLTQFLKGFSTGENKCTDKN